MKPGRIDVVSPDVWGSPGGIARVAVAVAAACRSFGADVRVHALHDQAGQKSDGAAGYGGNRNKMSAAVVKAGLQGSLVIFMHPNLAVLGPLFRWRSKYVVVSHGVEVWSPLSRARAFAMRQAAAHWAVSANTKWYLEEVQALSPDRVRVVHNSLGPGAVLPQVAGRGDYLLVVSRLHPDDAYKGVDLVIEAAAGRWPVVIAGDGPDRPRLEAIALRLGGNVTFLGRVDDMTLNAAFAGARAFVLPSAGEGFGLVYLEAMAHALPCVAAKAGGAPEVVLDGETGVVVPPRSVSSLAAAIERVWGEAGEVMGRRGRERLERSFMFERYEHDVHQALSDL